MKRILIIDDNREFTELMEMAIRPNNYEVTICSSMDDIDRLKRDQQYDLLIVDYAFGSYMADEILTKLAEEKKISYQKMLLISGSIDIDELVKKINGDAYLEKPFKLAELRKKIQELVVV